MENRNKSPRRGPGGHGPMGGGNFEKAKDFIYRNARPLDLAKW